jgi:hypothetical protein
MTQHNTICTPCYVQQFIHVLDENVCIARFSEQKEIISANSDYQFVFVRNVSYEAGTAFLSNVASQICLRFRTGVGSDVAAWYLCMCHAVVVEVRAGCEAFPAHEALVGLVPAVDTSVRVQ